MKKILILAYDFPPLNSIGGQRPYNWYKYFKESNIYPIVITRHWEDLNSSLDTVKSSANQDITEKITQYGKIIKVPFKSNFRDKILLKYGFSRFSYIRKIVSLFYSVSQFLTFRFDNKSGIYFASEKYLEENKVDYIIATGEPFILFRYAAKLSLKFNVPWIADYRDGWTTNFRNINSDLLNKVLNNLFFKKIEKQIVKNSFLITVASDSLILNIEKLHDRKTYTLLNGFDQDLINQITTPSSGYSSKKKFQLGYTGTIYPYQRLEIFLEGFNYFIKTNNLSSEQIEIIFIGSNYDSEQKSRIISFNEDLNKFITLTNKVSHKESIEILSKCDLLLVFANEKIDGSCAKIFEYLALNKKILCTVNDNGTLEKLLTQTNSGDLCTNSQDVEKKLSHYWKEYNESGKVASYSSDVSKYTRQNQTKKLADLLVVKKESYIPKKKALILAYDYPPYGSIAAYRPASWVKYLHEFGWEPTLITFHWDKNIVDDQSCIIPSFQKNVSIENNIDSTIIRVPFRPNLRDKLLHKSGLNNHSLIRKFLTLYYNITQYLILKTDHTRCIYDEAKKTLKSENFDLIIATGEPFILFRYAYLLNKEFGINWVADYRDAWTNNPMLNNVNLITKILNQYYFRKFENQYIKTCSLITTPSPSYKRLLKKIHADSIIEVIYNGHDINDPTELNNIEQSKEVFEIAYAGRFYNHQKLEVFLEGYRNFIKSFDTKINTRVIFYGLDFHQNDKKRLNSFDEKLNPYIKTTPRLDYQTLLINLKKANLLLLLSSENADWLNAKIFDYLPLDRKILLVTDDKGILSEIINQCEAGDAFENAEQVKTKLLLLYQEFLTNKCIQQKTKKYHDFSRKNQAEKFAKLLDKTVSKCAE